MTPDSLQRQPARRAFASFGLVLLAACSSVASVNDRAMLLQTEPRSAPTAFDPAHLMRPAQTEYRIGARDVLEIEVYELEEPGKSKLLRTRVSQEGAIQLPLIGKVPASGLTVEEVQADVAARLGADYLVNPTVSVVVAEHQARRITVLGAVKEPGSFFLQDNSTTLVDALARAGGPSDKAGSAVYVMREHGGDVAIANANARTGAVEVEVTPALPRLLKIDLVDLVERGDLSANCVLEDGDVVHVPQAAMFFVMGEVNEGGAFPLRGEITLLRAIALSGGLKETATPSVTTLIRTTPEGRITIPIDLDAVAAGTLPDRLMQADDVLVLNESGGARFTRGLSSFIRGLFHVSYGVR